MCKAEERWVWPCPTLLRLQRFHEGDSPAAALPESDCTNMQRIWRWQQASSEEMGGIVLKIDEGWNKSTRQGGLLAVHGLNIVDS